MNTDTPSQTTPALTRQERNRIAVRKYRQSDAGKAAMLRYTEKRRERNKAARQVTADPPAE